MSQPATISLPDPTNTLDGAVLTEDFVRRKVVYHAEQMVVNAYELGRTLLAWQGEVAEGSFESFLKTLPFSRRTAYNYMQTAAFLDTSPAVRKAFGAMSLKRTLLLATLAPDQVEQALQGGRVGEVEIPDIETVPYMTLKKEVEKVKKELGEVESERRRLEHTVDEQKRRLGDVVVEDKDALARLEKVKAAVTAAFTSLGMEVDAVLKANCHPSVKAHARGLTQWAQAWANIEELRSAEAMGEVVPEVAWMDLQTTPRIGADNVFRLPAHRVPATEE